MCNENFDYFMGRMAKVLKQSCSRLLASLFVLKPQTFLLALTHIPLPSKRMAKDVIIATPS